jgi:ParB family transcriptional regulator, chromosome partitioning protein
LTATGFSDQDLIDLLTPPNFDPATADEQGRLDEKAKIKCPECGHEFTT